MASLIVGALFFAACREPLPFEPAGPSAAPDPSIFGPYPVGVRTVTFYDGARLSTSTTTGERLRRKLVTEIWYPARESARGQPGYVYGASDIVPPSVADRISGDAVRLPTAAVRDAEPRDDDAPYPLVLFSHGNGGVRMQSTYFTVALASHGYIVVAPDHEGDTLADLLARGGLHSEDVLLAYDDRGEDLLFLLRRFIAPQAGDFAAGLVDPSRVGAAGHSFGALTSVRVAGLDPRVKACVAQAPPGYQLTWIGEDRDLSSLGIPILIESGGLDHTLPEALHAGSLWEEMARPRYWTSLSTAGHFTFSDLCLLDLPAIEAATHVGIGNVLEDGCGAENVPHEVAYPIIRHFGIGLFNAALRGSTGTRSLLRADAVPKTSATDVTVTAEP